MFFQAKQAQTCQEKKQKPNDSSPASRPQILIYLIITLQSSVQQESLSRPDWLPSSACIDFILATNGHNIQRDIIR